jgi:hypothetical protein
MRKQLQLSVLKTLTISATVLAGLSSTALAQYASCPPGYTYAGGVCQPYGYANPGYANPVTGAVSGTGAGAASGATTAGPVGAVVGGALGLGAGAVTGAANTVTGVTGAVTGVPVTPAYGPGYRPPAPSCPTGYMLYNGACYPAR